MGAECVMTSQMMSSSSYSKSFYKHNISADKQLTDSPKNNTCVKFSLNGIQF